MDGHTVGETARIRVGLEPEGHVGDHPAVDPSRARRLSHLGSRRRLVGQGVEEHADPHEDDQRDHDGQHQATRPDATVILRRLAFRRLQAFRRLYLIRHTSPYRHDCIMTAGQPPGALGLLHTPAWVP